MTSPELPSDSVTVSELEPLHTVVSAGAVGDATMDVVVAVLKSSPVMVIARPLPGPVPEERRLRPTVPVAPPLGVPLRLLHLQVGDLDAIPAFTSQAALKAALDHEPRWSTLQIYVVVGRELLDDVGHATVIINPWTSVEYHVPPNTGD